MTAATMLKRIETKRKEIKKTEKEIARYQKDYMTSEKPHMVAEGKKWIAYYRNRITKIENEIAKMSQQAADIATEEEQKAMIKAMAKDMAERGFKHTGYTTNGLRYFIEANNGWTERSLNCFTMYIDGKTVFTSGTLETVAEYILKN